MSRLLIRSAILGFVLTSSSACSISSEQSKASGADGQASPVSKEQSSDSGGQAPTSNEPISFTRATFEKIKRGMTRTEVDAILGRPPGNYTTGPWDDDPNNAGWGYSGNYTSIDRWIDDTGEIIVAFSTLAIPDATTPKVAWTRYFRVIPKK
jgi:hypothetical protein